MKRCSICKQSKPESEFNKHQNRKDGLQSHCRDCNRKQARDYYRRNKKKHLADIRRRNRRYRGELQKRFKAHKKTLACIQCGENHPAALEFHHRDPKQKEMSIANAVARLWSWERILKEIEKCDVLCANCHRILHYNLKMADEHNGNAPVF